MAEEGGNGSGVPLLHQWDDRWAAHPYGSGNVASCGCGATSFAMIARWYGVDISPADAADYATANDFYSGGTSWGFYASAASHWGFEMKQASRAEVEEALKKGYPCIGGHDAGMFTYGSHMIVYAKLTASGGLIVNDPNCGGGGPNDRGDDYVYNLNDVLDENDSGGAFCGFIPLTNHDGITPLMNDQSLGEYGNGGQGIQIVETNLTFKNLSDRPSTTNIVIHHTEPEVESGADQDIGAVDIHNKHQGNGGSGIGYHFVIRKDGTIERGRPEGKKGAHCEESEMNTYSVGIALSGTFNGDVQPTQAQVDNLVNLIALMCKTYSLSVDRDVVKGHREYDKNIKCPGDNLYKILDEVVTRARDVDPTKLFANPRSNDPSKRNLHSGDTGIRVEPVGKDTVRLTKLPEKKVFAEPIYPDYVTVSDTVPKWVLDQAMEMQKTEAALSTGEHIPNGDAEEKAPNGINYYENDIKFLMNEPNNMTREQAIDLLSKEPKYTKEVTWNDDGTFSYVEKPSSGQQGQDASSGQQQGQEGSSESTQNTIQTEKTDDTLDSSEQESDSPSTGTESNKPQTNTKPETQPSAVQSEEERQRLEEWQREKEEYEREAEQKIQDWLSEEQKITEKDIRETTEELGPPIATDIAIATFSPGSNVNIGNLEWSITMNRNSLVKQLVAAACPEVPLSDISYCLGVIDVKTDGHGHIIENSLAINVYRKKK